MRVLIDTNVVLDFVLGRQPFFIEADKIFFRLRNNNFEGYVSPIKPINVFYTTRKEIDKTTAFVAVEKLLNLTQITSNNNQIYSNALHINFSDYEDAVQHECAIAENLDAIVTRNTKDYKNASIKIYLPIEFLQHLKTI